MSREKKIAQYLRDANRIEEALSDVLSSRVESTPRGAYRSALRLHLRETRDHAKRTRKRLSEIDHAGGPIEFGIGLLQSLLGQALAVGRTPLDLLRGRGGADKLLKDAKDDCATVALEIATYSGLEHLARSLGDAQTAKLAASIRAGEEKMLDLLIGEIPTLTEAIASAEVDGKPSPGTSKTSPAATRRATTRKAKKPARSRASSAKRSSRPPRSGKRPSAQIRGGAKAPAPQPAQTTSAPSSEPRVGEPWRSYEEREANEIGSRITRTDDSGTSDFPNREPERERIVDVPKREFAKT